MKDYPSLRLEHVGIAVLDLAKSDRLFSILLGVEPYKQEIVEDQHVVTSFFHSGGSKIELVAATDPSSPIAKFIEKKGEGIHHLAFEVEDIYNEMERLAGEGFQLLQEKPTRGADNKLVCFLHPKSTNGVLIELCQQIRDNS